MSTNTRGLGWGIVGTGSISRSIAQDLRHTDARVVAVHSRTLPNATAFAEEFDIPKATDELDILLRAPDVDVVYIATPFATHHALARSALDAGKNVLVEKPMAMNTEEVRDLFALARSRGVFLMEAMWTKFTPGFVRLLDEVRQGRIGDVRSGRASFGIAFPKDQGSRWSADGSPGTLLDQGIYPVTLAHAIFGRPRQVIAGGVVREDGVDLVEHFTLEYEDGKFFQGAASMTNFTDLTGAVNGAEGWIVIDGMFWAMNTLEVHADDQRTMFVTPDRIEFSRDDNGYTPMLREVNSAIAQGQKEHPIHTADDTLAVFEILDEVREKLAQG